MDSPKSTAAADDPENNVYVKVIQWEDFEQELARLWSLSSALKEAKEKKEALQRKLEALIQVQAESLSRLNELDEIRQRVEDKKVLIGNMSMQSKVVQEHAKTKEEHLSSEIKSLLVSGSSLSVGRKRLQESTRLLSEERGHVRLRNLHKMLRTRQQYMISQVSFLYPLKTLIGPAQELELDSFASGSRPGTPGGSPDRYKPRSQGIMTISGLQLSMLPFTQMSFFPDKKQVQRSATALGYVAHAVSLIASYLHVPLRYPLRQGGSRSFIKDFSPSADSTSSDSSNTVVSANVKCLEFPLFLDGQDATRAAYAIFLLNKDIEQLLNYVGVNSLGPRHVLANLKELLKTILTPEFINK
ncbi:hypothetical protein Ancab_014048 [Ancistrocladus abbreviatus]